MVCVTSMLLLQESVMRYVLVMIRGHVPLDASLTNTTLCTPQLSDAVTCVGSGAGTSPIHSTVTFAGAVPVGFLMILRPLRSTLFTYTTHFRFMRYVLVMIRGHVPLDA